MQNYKKITVAIIFFLAVIFLLPKTVFAQGVWGADRLTSLNLGTQDLGDTIAGIINIALGFLGVIAVSIILYGGYLWMTAAGNAERIDKAKRTLINGFIGLIIIVSAYSIVLFLFGDAMDTMFGGDSDSGGGGFVASDTGLGAGVLDSHYPARYARGVARNTNIFVTFTEDMDFTTIVDCTPAASGIQTCEARPGYLMVEAVDGSDDVPNTDLQVTFDNDNPVSFSVNPYGNSAIDHLGSQTAPKTYNVILNGFETANEQPAFRVGNQYVWEFTVSTDVDLTPPKVVSVYPDGIAPLNTVVRVNFSEAVNPMLAAGIYPTFDNISLDGAAPIGRIEGVYSSTNQYRAVEFLTTNNCGTNTCGDPIFCLPREGSDPPLDYLVDGMVQPVIQDMAGNELDQDGNGTPGQPTDNYPWSFTITDNIDNTPPELVEMMSGGISDIDLEEPLSVRFNMTLMASSVNGRTLNINRIDPISGLPRAINYWASVTNTPAFDTILIDHDPFNPSTRYEPTLKSGIKNMTQNCWYPCNCNAASGGTCYCDNDPSYPPATDCPGPNCVGNCVGSSCSGSEI